MWTKAKISALGLYEYDNSVFDYFRVPDSPPGLQMETARDIILTETSDMSIAVYSSPESFKQAVLLWVSKNYNVWNELWQTLNYDYNPIHNYDREEHGKDKDDTAHTETPNITVTDHYIRDLTDSGTSDTTQGVGAFNEGMAQAEQNHSTSSAKAEGTSDNTNRRTGEIENVGHDVHTHDFHAFGNIGVTSTQQMIKEQREVVQFNLYDYILQDFKRHFCVMIY